MEMNIAEIFAKSPMFAKGIWFLLMGMSFWSLTVAVGKWNSMRKAANETKKFAPEFDQFLTESLEHLPHGLVVASLGLLQAASGIVRVFQGHSPFRASSFSSPSPL